MVRRRTEFFVFLVVAGAFSGCNCVGREFTLSRTFQVRSGPDDQLCSDYNATVNLGEDQSFKDLKNNIGKVELRKLMVKIVNPKVQQDSAATSASGEVFVSSGATTLRLGTYEPVPLTQDATQVIPFDTGAASTLANLALTPPNTFDIRARGCNDLVPAYYDFEVELTMYAELKLF